MSIGSNTPLGQRAAQIATVLFGAVILMQLLIAAGILPVSIVWGGRQTELTPGLRIASVVAAVILGVFALIIRRRAGLMRAGASTRPIKVLAWIVTAYMAFNTVTNLMSQSTAEKIIFVPITLILTVLCLLVSVSKTPGAE